MSLHEIIVLMSFIGGLKSEIWSLRQENAKFESTYISGLRNNSIIFKTFLAGSQLECASTCHNLNSISLYYLESDKTCSCNNGTDDNMAATTEDTGVRYSWKIHNVEIFKFGIYKKIQAEPVPADCLDYYNHGYRHDGIYQIQPEVGDAVETWCDMLNGGWTVIQRRQDGSEDFYRTFIEYVNGFGNRYGEYWLGLEYIHKLTLASNTLRIDMEAFEDADPTSGYVEYSTFHIDSADTAYVLHVDGYSGDCRDSLISRHNGRPFSAKDNGTGCAQSYKGAWWYGISGSGCHQSNLNGEYLSGYHTTFANGVIWKYCWGYYYSLKITVMKIRRNV